jgi:hypothetical protein
MCRGTSLPDRYNAKLGELYTKDPTDEAVHKLEDIARAMRTKLQGDDRELYPAKH